MPAPKPQAFCKLHRRPAHISMQSGTPNWTPAQQKTLGDVSLHGSLVGVASTACGHSTQSSIKPDDYFSSTRASSDAPRVRERATKELRSSELFSCPDISQRRQNSTFVETEHRVSGTSPRLAKASGGCDDIVAMQPQKQALSLPCDRQESEVSPGTSGSSPSGHIGDVLFHKLVGQAQGGPLMNEFVIQAVAQLEKTLLNSSNHTSSLRTGADTRLLAPAQVHRQTHRAVENMPSNTPPNCACQVQACSGDESMCSTAKLDTQPLAFTAVQTEFVSRPKGPASLDTSPGGAIVALGNDGKLSDEDFLSIKLAQIQTCT